MVEGQIVAPNTGPSASETEMPNKAVDSIPSGDGPSNQSTVDPDVVVLPDQPDIP